MPSLANITNACPSCGSPSVALSREGVCARCFFVRTCAEGLDEPDRHRGDRSQDREDGSGSGGARLPFPRSFGEYELLGEIGRGGMGVIYKARQRRLNRLVALKVMVGAIWASPDLLRRFETEAEAIARLDHPHIVPIYEIGEAEGLHFFSMKLVEGCRLDRLRRERSLPVSSAVALLIKIAQAVHDAHEHGVLHRDLKPSNVLVDADGEPILTDFGLAKLLSKDSRLTAMAAVLGTPSYIAPEQASGRSDEVTEAADIYGLGAILYELLTGRPPFTGDSPLETVRAVVERDPVPPSAHHPGLSPDLEVICLKCLEKKPGRRYTSAQSVADELGRWLRREPIRTPPRPLALRLGRWVGRDPLRIAAGASLALVLGIVAGTCWGGYGRSATATEQGRLELIRRDVANGNRRLEEGEYLGAFLSFAEALSLEKDEQRREQIHRLCLGALLEHMPRLEQFLLPTDLTSALKFSPNGRLLVTGSADGSACLWDLTAEPQPAPRWTHQGGVEEARFSPSGDRVVTMLRDGTTMIIDCASGRALCPPFRESILRRDRQRAAPKVSFSGDGNRVLIVFGSSTASVRDGRVGTLLHALNHPDVVHDAAFSPDGRWIVTASEDAIARVWDAESGAVQAAWKQERPVSRALFLPSSRHVVTLSDHRHMQVWEWSTGRMLIPPSVLAWRESSRPR